MKPHHHLRALCATALLGVTLSTWAQGPTFPIERFEIEGNTLLGPEQMATLVAPYQGQNQSFADIQLAQEALENAYRSQGYSAVAVTLPEQDISKGVVRFQIVEARLDTISVHGQQHFSQDNILRSLPALRSGDIPNTIEMAENLNLANENPAKRAEITLKLSDRPGFVNADVKVEEENPKRFMVSLDSTGQGSTTGDWRLGFAWQHANLFDLDHVLNLQYTTSPTHLKDVKQISAGYRIPLYAQGASLDMYAAHSNVDAGSFGSSSGIDGFVGKGQVVGMRYNLNLKRRGEYSHMLSFGLDWKKFVNNCTGLACAVIGADVVSTPFSVNYLGTWTRPGTQTRWGLSHVQNTGWGSMNRAANYAGANHQPGTQGTRHRFMLWRANASHLQLLDNGWQGRVAVNAQYTQHPLILGEQLGLAGHMAVRGFNEREVARDSGIVGNLELYTPNLAPRLKAGVDELRGLFFVDLAQGRYVKNAFEVNSLNQTIGSIGVGLRLTHQKRVNLKFDLAHVVNGTQAQPAGAWKGHMAVTVAF